jgi:hypothetical protein
MTVRGTPRIFGDRVPLSPSAHAELKRRISTWGSHDRALRELHVGYATFDRLLAGYARKDTVAKIETMMATPLGPGNAQPWAGTDP